MQRDFSINLTTPLSQALSELADNFYTHNDALKSWMHKQWELTTPPIYGSVDLRNAGFKIAPIDMNLFPAGFNNLNPNYLELSVNAAKKSIAHIKSDVQRILILPESHSRNLNYWANIKILQQLLQKAGFTVLIGSLNPEIKNKQELVLPDEQTVGVHEVTRVNNKLHIDDFVPDLIILNNDLSDGIPEFLKGLDHIIQPPAELGWSQRFKSEHFQYYALVTAEFSEHFKFDSWLIAPLFRYCGNINFMQQDGLDCLIHNAEILFTEIKKKYDEYNITQQPFLIVKADAGTYGMAVMTVRNVDELRKMNRKSRTKMSTIKGGQPVRRVIIQEGVYTFETVGAENAVAEPVVYLWGREVVGGFYRVHANRGTDENLNTPGMQFAPIAFTQTCNLPEKKCSQTSYHFYLYGIIAQLSMLAAAREIKELSNI